MIRNIQSSLKTSLKRFLDKHPNIKERIKNTRDFFYDTPPKLLVIGPPRSGFTLLISILNRILHSKSFKRVRLREELIRIVPEASKEVYKAMEAYFTRLIKIENLVVSPEFRLLVGGPKWLSNANSEMAQIRKYIGIRGMGDFLAVLSVPKYIMDYDRVIHSHSHPDRWLEDSYFRSHIKFASIRNPLDILNSSTLSLNALTGDYIDYHIKTDSEEIREKLGLYKLTDLNFIQGLIIPLKDYLDAFLPVKERYHVMRWEDLITHPVSTIAMIAEQAGLSFSRKQAKGMWSEMKFQNQTSSHRHNFRKGIIDDWKNHFVNEHLEIIKAQGIEEYMTNLGYGRIDYLDPRSYTPFQKRVASSIRNGVVLNEIPDPDLFIFAFNKSNFRSDKYDFISCRGKGLVDIERSSIKDESFLRGFMNALEEPLQSINVKVMDLYNRWGL